MHQLFAASLGSIACKSSCKEHSCLEGPSVRKILYRESPGQDRKSHSVVASRKKSDGPEQNALGLLSSLTVFLPIFTTHLLIKLSLELQLSFGAWNIFQARGCRLPSVSIESTTDNIIQVSAHIPLLLALHFSSGSINQEREWVLDAFSFHIVLIYHIKPFNGQLLRAGWLCL